jgi:hypothetical protein
MCRAMPASSGWSSGHACCCKWNPASAVHPYIRTWSGQSGSGIAALAPEFGIRAVFSNAPVFREIEKYFRGALPFFNIGNFVEHAQALVRYENFGPTIRARREVALQRYNPDGMIAKYLEALA